MSIQEISGSFIPYCPNCGRCHEQSTAGCPYPAVEVIAGDPDAIREMITSKERCAMKIDVMMQELRELREELLR